MMNEKNKVITFFIIVLLILSINNQNDLKQSYPTENIDGSFLGKVQDEIHTLLFGTREMFGESNDVNRVGSFSRTVVKSLSPIGVLYMNRNMGGEHHITEPNYHDYAGYSYLERNFSSYEDILYDPNIQNYRFGILLIRNFLFLLVLVSISYFLYKDGYIISSLFFLSSSLLNQSYAAAKNLIYTDFTNLLILYVFFLIYLITKIPSNVKNYLGILLVVAIISNGLSNILFVPVILTLIKINKKNDLLRYLVFFVLIFYLFNINELKDPINYLDNQLWNFYHYWTGHYLIDPIGIPMLKKIIYFSFPWIGSISLLVFIKFIKLEYKSLFLLLSLTQLAIIISASQLRHFEERQFLGLLISGIFLGTLFINSIENTFLSKVTINKYFYFTLIFIFSTYPLFSSSNNSDRIKNEVIRAECENIAVINDDRNEIDIKNADNFNVKITETVEAPTYFKSLEETVSPYDCLIIKENIESKNIATFTAPKYYKLGFRSADYYFFYK